TAGWMGAGADRGGFYGRDGKRKKRVKQRSLREGEAETAAFSAVRLEEAGDLALAKERWQELEKYKDQSDTDLRPWGLLAVKRMQELREADHKEGELAKQVKEATYQDQEANPGAALEHAAVRATRAERFEDLALALEQWQSLKERLPPDTDQRVWRLLAAKKVHELNPNVPRGPELKKHRRELVQAKLDEAASLQRKDPFEAKALCRDIIALYEKTTDLDLKRL